MKDPCIIRGRLHSPFFIYFRRDPPLTDEQILSHFGLTEHVSVEQLSGYHTYVVIMDVGEWTLLADDWHYHLWHQRSTKPAIATLAQQRDVFAWSIGDSDDSFAFCLYLDGQLLREYIVDSPNYNDQVVRVDFGEHLPLESMLRFTRFSLAEDLHRLAAELGIRPQFAVDKLRLFSKPFEMRLDPQAAIRNY